MRPVVKVKFGARHLSSRKKPLPLDERVLTRALTDRLAKKFAKVIDDVDYPSHDDGAWFYLKPGLCGDPESHQIHESTYGYARTMLESVSSCDCEVCEIFAILAGLGYKTTEAINKIYRDQPWLEDLIARCINLDIPTDQIVKFIRRTMATDSVTRTLILGSSDASLRKLAEVS